MAVPRAQTELMRPVHSARASEALRAATVRAATALARGMRLVHSARGSEAGAPGGRALPDCVCARSFTFCFRRSSASSTDQWARHGLWLWIRISLEYAHLIALEQTRPLEGPSAFTMVGVYLNRNQAARKIAKIIYTC